MAKEATYPNSRDTHEHALEYVGVEKQINDKVRFHHLSHATLATVLNMY